MSFGIQELVPAEFPTLLREIPQPPKTLNYRGVLPAPNLKLLAVVGSRRYTNYGKEALEYLIAGLAGYPVGIVSGLALGIDSLAHEAALKAGVTQVITDDGDYATVPGLTVFTANQRVVQAAHGSGKLLTR